MKRRRAAVFVALFLGLGADIRAETPNDFSVTARSRIVMGVQARAFPFSYQPSPDAPAIGFSVDLCERIIEAIRARRSADMPALRSAQHIVTSRNRIPYLLNGTIDIECGSTSANESRSRLGVAFSAPIFVSDIAVLAWGPGLSHIRDLANLGADASVITTAGSTAGTPLLALSKLAGARFSVDFARDHGESFRWLDSGRARAFAMDRVLLSAWLATHPSSPGRSAGMLKILDGRLSAGENEQIENYGLMFRSDDAPLRTLVNAVIGKLVGCGQMAALYQKWFQLPVPPPHDGELPGGDAGTVTIGLPPSSALRQIWQSGADAHPLCAQVDTR